MKVNVIRIDNTEKWDDELNVLNGSIFLNKKFLETLQSQDKKPVYLKFFANNEEVGMLAGFERVLNNGNLKHLFFFAGIVCHGSDPGLIKDCKKALLEFARDNGYARIILNSYDDTRYVDVRPEGYLLSRRRAECYIDLTQDEEEIKKGFTKNFVRLAKRAKKRGAILKYSRDEKFLYILFDLMENTYKERMSKGYGKYDEIPIPFLNRENLLQLAKKDYARFYYVEYKGEIVSIQLFIKIGCRCYGLLMGSNKTGYEVGAPSLLYYEATLRYKELGLLSFNLGGVPMDVKHQGIKRYKLTTGASLFESNEENTDFLVKPYTKLNYLLFLKRSIKNSWLPGRVKKYASLFLNSFIKGKDHP